MSKSKPSPTVNVRDSPDRAHKPDYAQLERRLRDRWLELSAEVRETLQRSDGEKFTDVAGDINDTEDKALADLIVDISKAEVARDVGELREIQAALQRIATGDYGICERCGAGIPLRRLEAYPTADRCLSCQEYRERNEVQEPKATL